MKIRHVKVSELPGFIDSDEFINSNVIPITRSRAISQFHNPAADPNDTALILVLDANDEITGYIGILPCFIYKNNQKQKIYSNTGWWVHPIKGRKASMILFYAMVEICGSSLFFADLTPHTTQILKATGFFEFPEPVIGVKLFLKFSLQTYLPRKSWGLKWTRPFLKRTDNFLNGMLSSLYPSRRGTKENYEILIQRTGFVDDESADLIRSEPKDEVILRRQTDLNWILKFPWLRISDQKEDNESQKYYFSTISKEFSNYCYKIFRRNTLVGFVFLTSREGNFKLPYYFCRVEDNDYIFSTIVNLLFQLKAVSFTTWNSDLIAFMQGKPRFFIYKKIIIKQEAFSKELFDFIPGKPKFQDGDGDMVFT